MKKSDKFLQEIMMVCEHYSQNNLNDYEINQGLGEALACGVVMPLIGGDCYVTKKDATKTIKAWTDGVYGMALGMYEMKVKQINKG